MHVYALSIGPTCSLVLVPDPTMHATLGGGGGGGEPLLTSAVE